MRRWKTKSEKILMGGLLLLLVASSLPWSEQATNNGFSTISGHESLRGESEGMIVGESVAHLSAQERPHPGPKSDSKNKEKLPPPQQEKKTPERKGDVDKDNDKFIGIVLGPEGKSYSVEADCSSNKDNQSCEFTARETQTEATSCDNCTYNAITGHYSTAGAVNRQAMLHHIGKEIEAIYKNQGKDKKDIVTKGSSKKPQKRDRRDDDYDDEDAIEKICSKKGYKNKKSEHYTSCAVKEMMRLATLSDKDERPTGDEMTDLIKDHVYETFLTQMKEGSGPEASREEKSQMRKADRDIERLIEKLGGSRYREARETLSEIKRFALDERAKNTAKILSEANSLAAMGDYVNAALLLNEFQKERTSMTGLLNADLSDMQTVYSNMIKENGFSRSNAMSEFKTLYYQPYNNVNSRLWSSNPTWDYSSTTNRSLRSGGFVAPGQQSPPISGIRGGTSGNYNGRGGVSNPNGPPVAGQQGHLGPHGVAPITGSSQQYPVNNPSANNGNYGRNFVPGQQSSLYSPAGASYNNGTSIYWPNNVNTWGRTPQQQTWIPGTPSPATPGIAGNPYASSYPSYYTGYTNHLYNSGTSPYPTAGWGTTVPGGTSSFAPMQPGLYGQQGSVARPRF